MKKKLHKYEHTLSVASYIKANNNMFRLRILDLEDESTDTDMKQKKVSASLDDSLDADPKKKKLSLSLEDSEMKKKKLSGSRKFMFSSLVKIL